MATSFAGGLYERSDRQRRRALVRELRAWLREERGEEAGDLAAGLLLEYVLNLALNLAGPDVYNAALADPAKAFHEHTDVVEADLAALTGRVRAASDRGVRARYWPAPTIGSTLGKVVSNRSSRPPTAPPTTPWWMGGPRSSRIGPPPAACT